MPTKNWIAGEEVLASDFNTYVQQQIVGTFPSTAARNAAFTGGGGAITPRAGMITYLGDTNRFEFYNGSAWSPYNGTVYVPSVPGTQQTAAVRWRAATFVATTTVDGVVGYDFGPALNDVYTIQSTPGDNVQPYFIMPVRGQFVRGATVAQWVLRWHDASVYANTIARVDFLICESAT